MFSYRGRRCNKPPDLTGNDSLKKGKKGCKDAVEFYTKAIEQKCDNAAKTSIFYANRAQAQSILGNTVRGVKKKHGNTRALQEIGGERLKIRKQQLISTN